MIEVIKQFFDSLLGYSLPEVIYQILGFTLVFRLFGLFFSILGIKDEKLWRYSAYVSIGLLAIIAISDTVNLCLTFGGV